MNLNSELVSKRLKTETNAEDESASVPVPVPDDGAGSASGGCGSKVFTSEDGVNTFVNVFTDDILPEIFDNVEILSTEDLFNFRLVNRCWRDAATSVLLKRNMTQITLDFGKVAYDENSGVVTKVLGDITPPANENDAASYKFFQTYYPKRNLTQLTQLMTTSAKFPCNRIYFESGCNSAFGNLCPISDCVNADQHQIDLLNFLSLHGNTIKELRLCDGISQQAIQNLLYVHMPNLTCLDIQELYEFLSQNETDAGNQIKVFLPLPLTLKLKEIFVPHLSVSDPDQRFDFVKELISVCPNVSSIHNVHTTGLGILLELGKFQFIKNLNLELIVHDMLTRNQLSQFLTDTISKGNVSRLQLSRLTIGLLDNGIYNDTLHLVEKFLNLILCASKDDLQYLTIYFQSSHTPVNILIPSLPNLEYLALHDYENEDNESFAETKIHFLGDVIGGAVEAHQSLDDLDTLIWPNSENINILANYFPRLCDVKLDLYEFKNNPAKLIQFFALDHLAPDGVTIFPGDTLSTVIELVLDYFLYPMYEINVTKLFPNLLHLKINYAYTTGLRNWVWTAFPKLKTFIIFGVVQGEDHDTNFADSFFTGFSPECCAQLGSDNSLKSVSSSSRVLERTQPYIGDCKNLKEFELLFGEELNSMFVSKVAAVHGFKDLLDRAKIIFTFVGHGWSVEKIQRTRQFLDQVSAYVEIQIDT